LPPLARREREGVATGGVLAFVLSVSRPGTFFAYHRRGSPPMALLAGWGLWS
jgi:hypothetical protein